MPPYPKGNNAAIAEAGEIEGLKTVDATAAGDLVETTIFGTPQVLPLFFKKTTESNWWKFPMEPLISVDGKNVVIKRNIAKRKDNVGTVKEYWAQDDWVINVQGLLTNPDSEEFPLDDFNTLKTFFIHNDVIEVKCKLLNELGITRIVIESYSLPFTKGPENQNFSFVACSDKEFSLLFKKKTSVSVE